MTDATSAVLGASGLLVLPSALRRHRAWIPGTVLILVETSDGVLLVDRSTALRTIREKLRAHALVEELLAERRAAAKADRDEF